MKPNPQHFSEVIHDEFQARLKKNSSYSIRAFARDLSLSPSALSDILNRKLGLSESKASEIAKKLNFEGDERKFFLTLVTANCSRIKAQKQLARAQLGRFETKYNSLSTDHFQVIAEWYHLAIMELTQIKGFSPSASWIAKKLQITEDEAQQALERLMRLEIIEESGNGSLKLTNDYLIVLSHSPSESALLFQKQILSKLTHAIEHHDRKTRDISSVVIRVRSSEINEIKSKLKDIRRDFSTTIQSGEDHDSVYCFTTAFFRLDRPIID